MLKNCQETNQNFNETSPNPKYMQMDNKSNFPTFSTKKFFDFKKKKERKR